MKKGKSGSAKRFGKTSLKPGYFASATQLDKLMPKEYSMKDCAYKASGNDHGGGPENY